MREVTLYQINATKMMAGSYVELHRYVLNPRDLIAISPNEAMMPFDGEVSVERLPVHCITRCERVAGQELRYTDTYIAIEDGLRKILEAPYEAVAQDAKHKLGKLAGCIDSFNKKPWWRRAWLAARSGISQPA